MYLNRDVGIYKSWTLTTCMHMDLEMKKLFFFMQKEFPSSAASRFYLIIYSGDNQDKITGIGPS
jgi:hypothetical protein